MTTRAKKHKPLMLLARANELYNYAARYCDPPAMQELARIRSFLVEMVHDKKLIIEPLELGVLKRRLENIAGGLVYKHEGVPPESA